MRDDVIEFGSYELQLQEAQRLIRLPDKNLGRIYRKHLEKCVPQLQDLIAGKCRSIQEIRDEYEAPAS